MEFKVQTGKNDVQTNDVSFNSKCEGWGLAFPGTPKIKSGKIENSWSTNDGIRGTNDVQKSSIGFEPKIKGEGAGEMDLY